MGELRPTEVKGRAAQGKRGLWPQKGTPTFQLFCVGKDGPFCVILPTFGNGVLQVTSDPQVLGKMHCSGVWVGVEAGGGKVLSCSTGEYWASSLSPNSLPVRIPSGHWFTSRFPESGEGWRSTSQAK